jgi:hypothetical protein
MQSYLEVWMCVPRTGSRWGLCPGCGRERRLARGGAVLCGHNRWDSAAWAMVPCEGSGRPPHPHDLSGAFAAQGAADRADGGRAA